MFWPLRVIAALTIIAPALAFTYAAWQTWGRVSNTANERIERALDVLQEHALSGLQTVDRSMSEINEVLRGLTDDEIRAREAELSARFKRTQAALPQIVNITAFTAAGAPLVSSFFLPVPPEQSATNRSYFLAQKDADAGAYISEVVASRVNTQTFFVVSARRPMVDGHFNGIVAATVNPGHFTAFYRKFARPRDTYALVRGDGVVLARFPPAGRIPGMSDVADIITAAPEHDLRTVTSPQDHIERRIGLRKVPGYPLYVEAGVQTAALAADFWRWAATQLAFGVPVMLVMFALAIYALRRAERFQEETGRREAAESALKQAQRLEAVGQLTGGVAHDFNNLLMVVSGNTERLKRIVAPDERARRALESIEIAVKRGADLTRHLLSFSRRQTYEMAVVDLKERLPLIQSMLQSSLRGDIGVQIVVAPDLWPTKIAVAEFELALLNMAVNARDAMSAGGRLTISAGNVTLKRTSGQPRDGDFLAVSVQDTGAGIRPEVLDRVFEPFFTTKDVDKGTGLGLSQVYGFAQQAGGYATIASTLGKGTTVTLYLPRSFEPAAPAPAPAAAAGVAVSGDRITVLVVEDNPEVARVTCGFLDDRGHTVHTAADVAAAKALLGAGARVDVVLSDIVMPGGENGFDLARWVRREYSGRLPVVLATGYSDKTQAAADEGFPLLRKPYSPEDLHRALLDALRAARAARVA